MNKLISDKKNLILIIMLILIIAVSMAIIIFPLTNYLKNSYQNYLDNSAKLLALEEKYKDLKELENEQKDIIQANENFLKFIPDEQESEDMMVTLDALAKQTSNSLPKFSVSEEEETAASGRVATKKIDISLEGSFSNILYFIQKIENLQRFNQIQSFSFNACPKTGNITSNLILNIFYKK